MVYAMDGSEKWFQKDGGAPGHFEKVYTHFIALFCTKAAPPGVAFVAH